MDFREIMSCSLDMKPGGCVELQLPGRFGTTYFVNGFKNEKDGSVTAIAKEDASPIDRFALDTTENKKRKGELYGEVPGEVARFPLTDILIIYGSMILR